MDERSHRRWILDGGEPLEPCFVLRASDPLAPVLVRLWASLAKLLGYPRRQIEAAKSTAAAMRGWRSRYL